MNEIIELFLLAFLASVIALSGGLIFLFNEKWSNALEKNSIPFAAGVLLTVSLIGLMPESLHFIGERAFTVVLITFVTAYLFEHLFFGIHHHQDHQHGHDYKGAIPLVIFGDTIHNFIDGIAIGVSYMVNPGLGLITAVSTLLHEVPHEIGDFGILLRAGWKRANILVVNIISASTTIAGAFLVFFISSNDMLIGTLLAISAGIFLYLGASDFLPHIEAIKGSKVKVIIPLLLGIAIMVFTLNLVPHTHEGEPHYEEDHVEEPRESEELHLE